MYVHTVRNTSQAQKIVLLTKKIKNSTIQVVQQFLHPQSHNYILQHICNKSIASFNKNECIMHGLIRNFLDLNYNDIINRILIIIDIILFNWNFPLSTRVFKKVNKGHTNQCKIIPVYLGGIYSTSPFSFSTTSSALWASSSSSSLSRHSL